MTVLSVAPEAIARCVFLKANWPLPVGQKMKSLSDS